MKHYIDIENLREDSNEFRRPNTGAFEFGDIISISEKIDGSNASFTREGDKLLAFSRRQKLNFNKTLEGFWNWVQTLDPSVFDEKYIFFGEWLRKNKIKYSDDKINKFYLFDIYDKVEEKWLLPNEVKHQAQKYKLEYIHEFYQGPFSTWEFCKGFMNSPQYGDVQEGCFNSRTKILMSDGTEKYITQVVPGDCVKTYNIETKSIEDKRVLNVFDNGYKKISEWISLAVFPKGACSRGLISGYYCATKNHKYWTGNRYESLENIDCVYHYSPVFDYYRLQAFMGMMCSDGNVSNYIFSFSQKEENMDHFEKLFDGFLSPSKPVYISGKGSEIKVIYFQKRMTEYLLEEYVINHNTMNRMKMFQQLEDVGWAYFFIGDGSNVHGQISLCVARYTEDEIDIIKKAFEQRYGVKLSISKDKRVSNGHSGITLRILAGDGRSILKIWEKYIPEKYRYKLGDIVSPYKEIEIPPIQHNIIKRKLYSKRNTTDTSRKTRIAMKAYDLEVEDNHNYFANGCLVHNCVIRNVSKMNNPNYKSPTILKIVNDSFKETMSRKREPDPQKEAGKKAAQRLISTIVTPRRVEKMIFALRDEGVLPDILEPKDMKLVAQNLPKRVYEDCVKEEPEVVQAAGDFGGKAISSLTMKIAREMILGE